MLGNNADAFFTTPMRTSIVKGNQLAGLRGEMPAPFGTSSATREFSMLPGIGAYTGKTWLDQQLGVDAAQVPAVQAEVGKFLGMTIPVAIGVGIIAFILLRPKFG